MTKTSASSKTVGLIEAEIQNFEDKRDSLRSNRDNESKKKKKNPAAASTTEDPLLVPMN